MSRLVLLILGAIASAQDVVVSNGKISVVENVNCNITMYDHTMYNVKGELPGLYYGLIKHECDNAAKGYTISSPKCFNCGVYCPQNDLLLTCNHFWFPFIMGSVIGSVCAALTFYGLRYIKDKYLDNMLRCLQRRKPTRRGHKLQKIRKFLLEDAERTRLNQAQENGPSQPRRNSAGAILLATLMASSHIRGALLATGVCTSKVPT